jgi:hypothetical protein
MQDIEKFHELYTTRNKKTLRALHDKKGRSFASSAQQGKKKLHEFCTTRNINRKL